jgi:hypothetical protein
MIKILGFMDILSSAVLISQFFNIHFPKQILIFFCIYLLIKGIIFFKFLASWIDIFAGILIIFLIFGAGYSWIRPAELIAGFLILQKGLFSLLG